MAYFFLQMQQQLFELEQKRRDALSQLKHVQDTAAFHPKEEIKSGLVRIEASKQRLEEIAMAVKAGAREIDMVITRTSALTGDWPAIYEEVQKCK